MMIDLYIWIFFLIFIEFSPKVCVFSKFLVFILLYSENVWHVSRSGLHLADKNWKIHHFSKVILAGSHILFLIQNLLGNSKKESDMQIYHHKYLFFAVFKHRYFCLFLLNFNWKIQNMDFRKVLKPQKMKILIYCDWITKFKHILW